MSLVPTVAHFVRDLAREELDLGGNLVDLPLMIGANVLVGPRAYLTGCTVESEVFLAAARW